MKKSFTKNAFILVMFLVILGTSLYMKSRELTSLPDDTLIKSFHGSGAKVLSGEVYLWAKVGKEYTHMDELKILAQDFSKSLGILKNDQFSSKAIENDMVQTFDIRGVNSDNILVNISVKINKETQKEKFVTVSIIQDRSVLGLEEVKKKALQVFKKHSMHPKVNMCITGNFDGKLGTPRLNEVAKCILNGVDAKKVEGMRDESLISVSAYSPFIRDSIEVNGNKVNLNLAIRYNSFEDKTYIWVATPVITTEY